MVPKALFEGKYLEVAAIEVPTKPSALFFFAAFDPTEAA